MNPDDAIDICLTMYHLQGSLVPVVSAWSSVSPQKPSLCLSFSSKQTLNLLIEIVTFSGNFLPSAERLIYPSKSRKASCESAAIKRCTGPSPGQFWTVPTRLSCFQMVDGGMFCFKEFFLFFLIAPNTSPPFFLWKKKKTKLQKSANFSVFRRDSNNS